MGSAFLINHAGMVLKSIAITHAPTKTKYSNRSGSNFNTAGMEVTATYMNGIKKVITGYTYSPTNWANVSDSNVGTKNVTISYTEGGITKTATQQITLIKATEKHTFTAVSGYVKKVGPVILQTNTVNIGADYQNHSEFKVYWKLTQSRQEDDRELIVYNDTNNYRTYLVTNSSTDTLVGNSPYPNWGATERAMYVYGRAADKEVYPTGLGKVTKASLKFTNTASTDIYLTLEGAILITTAY